MKIAVFPGSFDPITLGHYDIIERATKLFDHIIVALGSNGNKNCMFGFDQRRKWLEDAVKKFPNVEVDVFEGLTVNYCKSKKASFILRGLRNPADFEFEKSIAHTNRHLSDNSIETVFLLTSSGKSFISSSNVRDVIKNNGDYTLFVPKEVRI